MTEIAPIFLVVFRQQRRTLAFWALALAAISAMYLSFYPSMGGDTMDDLVANLPEDMVTALGYDTIGTGARLLAGEEEAGTLELEATGPVSRLQILVERLVALVAFLVILVGVVTAVSWLLVLVLDMGVAIDRILAGSAGLLLLILGFGSIAFAIGAATGNRSVAVGVSAALAVTAFMFDALGPVVEVDWMSTVSPFFWYLGNDPLIDGFDWEGLGKLAIVPVIAWAAAVYTFPRRDLNV